MSETPAGQPQALPQEINWAAIETLYRTGQLSVREIARQHGVSHTTIHKRAKAEMWVRDLSDKIAAGVRQAVYTEFTKNLKRDVAVNRKQENEIVKTAIEEGKGVVLRHQRLGTKLFDIAEKLVDVITDRASMAEHLEAKDLNFLARAIYSATAAAQRAIEIERQARGLDAISTDPNAPSAIHITYYRSDSIQDLRIGGSTE